MDSIRKELPCHECHGHYKVIQKHTLHSCSNLLEEQDKVDASVQE